MSDDLRAAAEKVRDWLRDERMGSWRYMENGDFYSDLTGMAELLDAALAAEQPSVPRPGKYLRWWPIRSAAAEQPQPVASGWKLVPVEPTLEMLSAPLPESPIGSRYESRRDLRSTIYLAMLAAAPPPPDAAEQPVAWAVAFNGRADIDYAYRLRDGAESAADYLRAHKAELGPFTVVPLFAAPPPPAAEPGDAIRVLRELVALEADGKHADEWSVEVWGRARAVVDGAPAPAEQPQPVASGWRDETVDPTDAGWYAVRREDGTLCIRAWGTGRWWIPLRDGWLSGIPRGFSWLGPLASIDWSAPPAQPAAEPPSAVRDLLIQAAAMAVVSERQGKYPGAADVADAILTAAKARNTNPA